jgi:glycosyltransferase involved in cell wall biosynthesis
MVSAAALDYVQLDGYLDGDELAAAYGWATAVVLPSYSEGFPRVAYEATAYGAALVLTPVGGIPYRLRDGVDAVFVPVGDPGALAAALTALAAGPDRTATLADAAKSALAPAVRETAAAQFGRHIDEIVARSELGRMSALGSTREAQ